MKRKLNSGFVFDVFNVVFMLFIIFITLYPIYHVLVASFSDPGMIARHIGPLWLPIKPYSLKAYEMVFADRSILTGFGNTAFVLIVGLIVNLTLTALGAFFLTIKGPAFKNVVAVMIIFTMYFSGGMIPAYLNMRDLGLLDSRWAMILPGAISTTNLIIMKSAFEAIPPSLLEAARLDGASYLKILLRVMVPLSKATIAVLVLYYGVAHWNAWFGASIYLRDRDKFPLQLVMRNILLLSTSEALKDVEFSEMGQYSNSIKYALVVVGTAPILVLYPFLQKYFVKGSMIGAVKG